MPKHLGELPSLAAKKFGNKEALFLMNVLLLLMKLTYLLKN